MHAKFGPIDLEAGTMKVRRLGLSIPDGLHLWFGTRGVHLFWHGSSHAGRVTFERAEERTNK
jgi:hypothetical protein